jgi:hypothetical protein
MTVTFRPLCGPTVYDSMEYAQEVNSFEELVSILSSYTKGHEITLEEYNNGKGDMRVGWKELYIVLDDGQACGFTNGKFD